MSNLAGHDVGKLVETFEAIDHDRPVAFFAYTIKGYGLPLAGHKDNHAGLMTAAQMEELRTGMNVRSGREWDASEGLSCSPASFAGLPRSRALQPKGRRRFSAARVAVPDEPGLRAGRMMSTQEGFWQDPRRNRAARRRVLAAVVTLSPDVSVSTNLGPWINRRGLCSRATRSGTCFQDEKVVSAQKWVMSRSGQHIELGIAENNLFIMLAALGLSSSLFGERLLPVGTLYDPFIARGLDSLNYACYQSARFLLVATPSGLALAPEGGAHQSIGTPLIGLAQDGLAAFEPAFVDELAVIMAWAFDYMQRGGEGERNERNWLRDETGGSVYLRSRRGHSISRSGR